MTNTNLISPETIASLVNKEIVAMLMSNEEEGLTTVEAELRLKEFGGNIINASKPNIYFWNY